MEINETRLWFLIRWLVRRLRFGVWRLLDWMFGVRTTFVEPTGALKADDPGAHLTKPSPWLTTYRALRRLEVGPSDALVDFGSGTGRAVLTASLFPFRRVIGIEREESLHRQALHNLAHFRPRRRAPVEFICGDALEYKLPDDVTVVFFYNPFGGETFRRVVESVLASVDRVPRRLRLMYVNPMEHEYLLETGRCRLVETIGGLRPTRAWARMLAAYIYEVAPAYEAAPAAALPEARVRSLSPSRAS